MKKESDSYVIDGMRIRSEARKRRRRKGGGRTENISGLVERENESKRARKRTGLHRNEELCVRRRSRDKRRV